MVKALITGAALLGLAACATNGAAVDDPRQVWCDHSEPRRDATPEAPRAELDKINAHNFKGERWCGWKP